jgi:DNA-binding NarL/FixJ family response regulator
MVADSVRLAVIDDHPLLREGVVSVLAAEPGFEVVGEGNSAADAVTIAEQMLPDILLLDVSIPGGGIEAASLIAANCPVVKIVMLTVAEDEETVTTALQCGARGYLLKGISGPDLIGSIWRMHRGESYISPHLAARLLAQMDLSPDSREAPRLLTEREELILARVVKGHSYADITRDLAIAEATVKNHMTNVLQKLHHRNRGSRDAALA